MSTICISRWMSNLFAHLVDANDLQRQDLFYKLFGVIDCEGSAMRLPRDNMIQSVGFHITQHVMKLDRKVRFASVLLLGKDGKTFRLAFKGVIVILASAWRILHVTRLGSRHWTLMLTRRERGCHGESVCRLRWLKQESLLSGETFSNSHVTFYDGRRTRSCEREDEVCLPSLRARFVELLLCSTYSSKASELKRRCFDVLTRTEAEQLQYNTNHLLRKKAEVAFGDFVWNRKQFCM